MGIDNVLTKIADPIMIGHCVKKDAEVVSKYLTKAKWDEPIGMHVYHDGDPWVVEYSDMSDELKKKTNEDKSLTYGEGFICTFMGTLDYFKKV